MDEKETKIVFRVTPVEQARIQAKAKKAGKSVSEFLRDIVFESDTVSLLQITKILQDMRNAMENIICSERMLAAIIDECFKEFKGEESLEEVKKRALQRMLDHYINFTPDPLMLREFGKELNERLDEVEVEENEDA
jgi:hypothetical protein